MEQYLNLVWKNYTTSLSQNSDEDFSGDHDDTSDAFAANELHYKIPFWIGVIVISLLFLSAIIATIRYCFNTLCSSHTETEKMALMPPKSPCLSSRTVNTIQRQVPDRIAHHLSDDNEPEQLRNHRSNISIVPIVGQYSRSHFTPSRHHHTEIDTNEIVNHYLTTHSRAPVDFRKKMHDIYVLPVSPALSSSSSTTNTDEIIKTNSSTMPIRSRRHLSSAANNHNESTYRGIKNDSFTDSPQLKGRTLPRSHGGTLKRIQPPSQAPPVPPPPPTMSHLYFTDILSSIDNNNDKSLFQHKSATIIHDEIPRRFSRQNIYGTVEENSMKKPPPPPIPCRSQKPTILPIGFEALTTQSDVIGFPASIESSPQDDYSEHAWPKPPSSMSTSETSGPLQIFPSSTSYNRLHHDHLIPTVIMRQNSTTNFFHQHRHGEQSMLTESES